MKAVMNGKYKRRINCYSKRNNSKHEERSTLNNLGTNYQSINVNLKTICIP